MFAPFPIDAIEDYQNEYSSALSASVHGDYSPQVYSYDSEYDNSDVNMFPIYDLLESEGVAMSTLGNRNCFTKKYEK